MGKTRFSRTTVPFSATQEAQQLPPLVIPISTRLIVAGAIATRDFQDVHHDRQRAQELGAPDIFMNILTTGGLVNRYLMDWAGPEALLRSLQLRLGVPNHPGDTLSLSGSITKRERRQGEGCVSVEFVGNNERGAHVSGSALIALPEKAAKAARKP